MIRTVCFLCLSVVCFIMLSGCAPQYVRSSSSTSLSDIIEPVKDSKLAVQKEPLRIPASVAILAVPDKQQYGKHIPNTSLRQAAEKLKLQLLTNPQYISSVAIVATDDIKDKVSLEKIRSLYAADIVIILSYQQDQRSSQSGAAGLADATFIGMFLVPGVEIKTSTVIDGKVIHIPSNAIMFRTSGTDERSTNSTTHAVNSTATEESVNGILSATADFGNSLNKTLTKFENYDLSLAVPMSDLSAKNSSESAKGKASNDYWAKVDNFKSTGGGALDIISLMITSAICCAAWRRR